MKRVELGLPDVPKNIQKGKDSGSTRQCLITWKALKKKINVEEIGGKQRIAEEDCAMTLYF